ncbi:response regulator [Paraburkholderia tuberum]|uniref:response regulator n=1 Tax=Paraburkholderia tuberum TaxID=157910 RepID=UPI000B8A1B7A|nr:response regulator [Paraburkholderia tuberum]
MPHAGAALRTAVARCLLFTGRREYPSLPPNRCALQLALESRRHRVVLAENGWDAPQKAHTDFPELVITDLEMPEMDRKELCRRLKCQAVFSGLPVVLQSAMPEPTEEIRCWTAFLRKPASIAALLDAVDRFIAARLTYARAATALAYCSPLPPGMPHAARGSEMRKQFPNRRRS